MNLNGSPTAHFPILRGVRQGCPLVPYLFIFLIGEVLNQMVKGAVKRGEICAIALPNNQAQQIISQYADNIYIAIKKIWIYFQILDFLVVSNLS